MPFLRRDALTEQLGRVQGWESVCRAVLGLPYLEMQKVTKLQFHGFE